MLQLAVILYCILVQEEKGGGGVQFWGADFKNRCFTGQYRGLQPHFDA